MKSLSSFIKFFNANIYLILRTHCDIIQIYPQVLINAKVDGNKKYDYDKDNEIKQAIEKLEKEFSGNSRVLIRPSGTEPLVRVMIEGTDKKQIETKAKELAELIEKKLK